MLYACQHLFMAGEEEQSMTVEFGMADPIYMVHVLVATTLLVLGILLIVDGINEGA
jgi:hypothetical protein